MKKLTLKDCYIVGDFVQYTTPGIVIYVTSSTLKVKNEYGTSTFTDVQDIESFKDEVKVVMHIGSIIKKLSDDPTN